MIKPLLLSGFTKVTSIPYTTAGIAGLLFLLLLCCRCSTPTTTTCRWSTTTAAAAKFEEPLLGSRANRTPLATQTAQKHLRQVKAWQSHQIAPSAQLGKEGWEERTGGAPSRLHGMEPFQENKLNHVKPALMSVLMLSSEMSSSLSCELLRRVQQSLPSSTSSHLQDHGGIGAEKLLFLSLRISHVSLQASACGTSSAGTSAMAKALQHRWSQASPSVGTPFSTFAPL